MDEELRRRQREAGNADAEARARLEADQRRLPAAVWNPLTRVRCQLAFACPKGWDAMEPTDDPRVRRCDHCESPVHEVRTIEEFREHAIAQRCVSVPADADLWVSPQGDATAYRHQLVRRDHRLTGPAVQPATSPLWWLLLICLPLAAVYGLYRLGLAWGWW